MKKTKLKKKSKVIEESEQSERVKERYHRSIGLLGHAVLVKLLKLLREILQVWEEKTGLRIHFSQHRNTLFEISKLQ